MLPTVSLRQWSQLLPFAVLAVGLVAIFSLAKLRSVHGEAVAARKAEINAATALLEALDARSKSVSESVPGAPVTGCGEIGHESFQDYLGAYIAALRASDQHQAAASASSVGRRYQALLARLSEQLLDGAPSEKRDAMLAEVNDRVSELRHLAATTLGECSTALIRENEHTLALARNWHLALVVCVLLAAIVSMLFRGTVEQQFAAPLREFGDRLRRLSAGEGALRMPPQKDGLMERLGQSINGFVDVSESRRERDRSRFLAHRRYALALLETYPQPAFLVDGSGVVLLTNSGGTEMLRGHAGGILADRIRNALARDRDGREKGVVVAGKHRLEITACDAVRGFDGALLTLVPEDNHVDE